MFGLKMESKNIPISRKKETMLPNNFLCVVCVNMTPAYMMLEVTREWLELAFVKFGYVG